MSTDEFARAQSRREWVSAAAESVSGARLRRERGIQRRRAFVRSYGFTAFTVAVCVLSLGLLAVSAYLSGL